VGSKVNALQLAERHEVNISAQSSELRISQEDSKVYTFEELTKQCQREYTPDETMAYWEESCIPICKHPIGRFIMDTLGLKTSEEARRDPADDELRTFDQLLEHYRGRYSSQVCADYWLECKCWWRAPGSHQCSGRTMNLLLTNMCLSSLIRHEEVLRAMAAVDRWNYVPDTEEAYNDSPQLLGPHATISAPHIHAQCLELLAERLVPGACVLDIGCGSGYLAAAMARMVCRSGRTGHVVAIDYLDYLVELSLRNIGKADSDLLSEVVECHKGDGWLGWQACAPFDVIHVGAAAATVPEELLKQLKPGGRMVIPVGNIHPDPQQKLVQVDRLQDGTYVEKFICGVRYVPLVKAGSGPAGGEVRDEDVFENVS